MARFRCVCLAGIALIHSGCLFSTRDGEGGKAGPGPGGTAEMHLSLQPAALIRAGSAHAAPVDSVYLRFTAADMVTMEFTFSGDSLDISLAGLPVGSNRLLTASLFRDGRLLYAGKTLCELRKEVRADIHLRCEPRFSRVGARFHLPAGLPSPVTQGFLELSGPQGSYRGELRIQDEFGSFLLDEVPGNARYDVKMGLSDAGGKILFEAAQQGVLLPLGEEALWDLPLLPTQAAAGVALVLLPAGEAALHPGFPSRKRRPSRPDEIILSEFCAAPAERDSGTNGEWWELFNRTADTLLLEGCRLSRDRSGGATRSYAFEGDRAVLPGRALVFGRRAARADVRYEDFTLVNTASALLLLCAGDSLLLDSLRYSATVSDSSALPMREGLATSLDADRFSLRSSPASWCVTRPGDSTGPGWASPGQVPGGCRAQSESGGETVFMTPFLKKP